MARTWRIAKKFRLSLGELWVRKDLFDQLRPIVLYFAIITQPPLSEIQSHS